MTKQQLKDYFASRSDDFYRVELFEREGFERRRCPKCGKHFWSIEKSECGDSTHTPYTFIKQRPRDVSYADMWRGFASYWKAVGHTEIPRYPVLTKWRGDLYYTIASIVDFQRLFDSQISFVYPANPLIVPQVCLRFNDLANVGITGRHLSCFVMAGQHAFNAPKEGYWRDACIEYNYNYLTRHLGIPKEELTYHEDVWAMGDLSALGPSMESFAYGLEFVNSVFMEFRYSQGELKPLPMKVIDVGWGFERLLWFSSGALTVYDAIFSNELRALRGRFVEPRPGLWRKYVAECSTYDIESMPALAEAKERIAHSLGLTLKDYERELAPMQALYMLLDHSRGALFALCDGAVPSNTAGGYNLRVLMRRALAAIQRHGFDIDLFELMALQAKFLGGMFPELEECLPRIQPMIEAEEKKFADARARARRVINEVIRQSVELTNERMAMLYESHGITPELVEGVAEECGVKLSIPTSFYRALTDRHLVAALRVKELKEFVSLQPTRLLYLERPSELAARAKVLAKRDNAIVLDATPFYPEGGGQASDVGTIKGLEVFGVELVGGVAIHHLRDATPIKVGEVVEAVVDAGHRSRLAAHHTATHILLASARRLLGTHVWQAGARKEAEGAHVDITHYEKLSWEQRRALESLANNTIREDRRVSVEELPISEAEARYGWRLYQGGGAPGEVVRIVVIDDIDAQACCGTHASRTGEVRLIKIVRVEQIQDGVTRIYFKAGDAALDWLSKREEEIEGAASALRIGGDELPGAALRFHGYWLEERKRAERLEEALAEAVAARLLESGATLIEARIGYEAQIVAKIAARIASSGRAALLIGKGDYLCAAAHPGTGLSALELLKSRGAVGGGDERFAQGKIKKD